jgi:hypothetical protein
MLQQGMVTHLGGGHAEELTHLRRNVRVVGMVPNKWEELIGIDEFDAEWRALGIQVDIDRRASRRCIAH